MISDSGKYSGFGYPDIRIPVEITTFDVHNYCPTCRESGKGDDPCVTFEMPCPICSSFTEEQMQKISQRKRYIRKQKSNIASSKYDGLDLLGDNVESFCGSNADLDSAADNFLPDPHVLSPYLLVPYLSKRQQSLSHPPQVLPYSRKLN